MLPAALSESKPSPARAVVCKRCRCKFAILVQEHKDQEQATLFAKCPECWVLLPVEADQQELEPWYSPHLKRNLSVSHRRCKQCQILLMVLDCATHIQCPNCRCQMSVQGDVQLDGSNKQNTRKKNKPSATNSNNTAVASKKASAYMVFSRGLYGKLQTEHPEMKLSELAKEIESRWNALDELTRQQQYGNGA